MPKPAINRTLRPHGPVEFSAGHFQCRFEGGQPWIGHAATLDMGRGWLIVFMPEDYDPHSSLYTGRILEQRHLPFVEPQSLGRARRA